MTEMTARPFEGEIGVTVAQSRPAWEGFPRPAAGAPNVVVIVLDDLGFAQLGCYGGSTRTPAIDALADAGVRYANFHVTSLCSPSRASLLTGRNHHSVGMSFLAAFDTGYPNSRGHVSHDAAMIPRMLREEGYATYAVGKWHLVPPSHMSPAGPFEHWPLAKGFDRYYGFLWGEDDQWHPQLWEDNHFVDPPTDEKRHLTDVLVDRAERMIGDHLSAGQDRPFFLYLSLGAMHAPHQAPRDFIERYRGAFDHGWDEERRRVLERQIATGLVPSETELPPSNPDVAPWDSLSADEKALYARMQEVFSGFLEHTDAAIGRLMTYLEEQGVADDTTVVLLSDNGASGEGGPHGSVNEFRYFLGVEDSLADNLAMIDDLGGPETHNHYPNGWAQAGNTPLRMYKKFNFEGGVRAPLIIRSVRDRAATGIRTQFHHIIDVAPTILDYAGISPRESYDGIPQQPLHGASMASTVRDDAAPEPRRTQYFEMAGQRAIWHDGWKAVTHHEPGADYQSEPWLLFDTRRDFSEAHDLAADHPERLSELVRLWNAEAARFGVFPLDDRLQERARDRGPLAGRDSFTLRPGTRLFSGVAGPDWINRSFSVTARIDRESTSQEGVILAWGRRAAGFAFAVVDNRLVLDYNLAGDHALVTGPLLAAGQLEIQLRMRHEGRGRGFAELLVDGEVVAGQRLRTITGGFGPMSTQVGHSGPSAVSSLYEPPFAFPGRLSNVEVRLAPHDIRGGEVDSGELRID